MDERAPARGPVPGDTIERTIAGLTKIDETGDKRSMDRMVKRLGKEQPALLQAAAALQGQHEGKVGEVAVFYSTLVWAIYDRFTRKAPRLTARNIEDARTELGASAGADADHPPALLTRQPHLVAKLDELFAEDLATDAIAEPVAKLVMPHLRVIVEAFDAAVDGRRPGERLGPIMRDTARVGRNDLCPCGSGKKFKRCCG